MRQQYLVDTADTFKTYVFENNRKIVPTSATLTVYKPGGDTKLIDAVAMTVGADGLLSYSLTTTHNDIADLNYKAVVSYVYNAITYPFNLFYDVVHSKLTKVVTDEDVVNELPQLKENGWRTRGTATSGSTTTIVDNDLKRFEDDYFTGGTAQSLDQDETREITDFVSSSGTATTTAFTATMSGNDYILMRAFTKEIQRAFEKIEELIYREGKRAHLILDPYDLREVHICFSVAEICKGLMTEESGLWFTLWQEYDKRGYAIYKSISFKYDTSEDGYIAGAEKSVRTSVRASRG